MNSKVTPVTVTSTVGAAEGDLDGVADGASVIMLLGTMDGDTLGAGVESEGLELGDTLKI